MPITTTYLDNNVKTSNPELPHVSLKYQDMVSKKFTSFLPAKKSKAVKRKANCLKLTQQVAFLSCVRFCNFIISLELRFCVGKNVHLNWMSLKKYLDAENLRTRGTLSTSPRRNQKKKKEAVFTRCKINFRAVFNFIFCFFLLACDDLRGRKRSQRD